MMQAMRDQVKIVYWIVIFFFVLLMFFAWGMGTDFGGQPMGASGGSADAVAEVNGEPISYRAWQERSNNILQQMRAGQTTDQPLSENQRLRAQDQAYDELVSEAIQRQAAADMGIRVTDEEIVDVLSNNPPQELLQMFVGEDGQVDYEAYYQALQDETLGWDRVEAYLRTKLPLQKLELLVSGGAVVGEAELRQAFREQELRMVAEYIEVPLSDVELPEGHSVPEDELQAYYNEHLHEYQLAPRAVVRTVSLPKEASAEDRAEVISILEEYKADIEAGTMTFEEAASTISEDPSASQGGDLGFFDRERMVAPFTEVAFTLPVGEVSDPVVTQFGVHLIRVEEERLGDDGEREEVRARHILLKLHPGPTTIADLRDRAQALRERAASDGLEPAASTDDLTVVTSAPFQEGLNIPGIPNSLPGANFAFANEAGALSPVLENEERLYIVQVEERLPAGHRPLDEVRALIETAVQREHRMELAIERLRPAWDEVRAGTPVAEAASNHGLSSATTDSFTLRENIPGIGFGTAFARAALELEAGGTAFPVQTRRGAYGLRVVHKDSFDEAKFRAQRQQLASNLLFSKQRRILEEWMEQRRRDADVVDYRARFL